MMKPSWPRVEVGSWGKVGSDVCPLKQYLMYVGSRLSIKGWEEAKDAKYLMVGLARSFSSPMSSRLSLSHGCFSDSDHHFRTMLPTLLFIVTQAGRSHLVATDLSASDTSRCSAPPCRQGGMGWAMSGVVCCRAHPQKSMQPSSLPFKRYPHLSGLLSFMASS